MSEMKINNIAKNTSYLTLAFIIQKVFSFIYFVILARNLGPETLGKYYFAVSLTTIFAIFIDLGLVNYLTRETAKNREGSKKLLANVLGLKVISSLLSVLAVFIFVNLLGEH
ncbi:MAG: oligosaccharide flippase family protein, partial [Patescibacteria group bacterium]